MNLEYLSTLQKSISSTLRVREAFDTLTKSEIYGLTIGLFPIRLYSQYHLTTNEIIELTNMAERKK